MKKTILITGSADGIGNETAFELAELGHNILLHGRSEEKLNQEKTDMESKFGRPFKIYNADLSLMKNVVELANKIKEENDFLDVLINNAGTFTKQPEKTNEGLELTFAVNYIAPFILSIELMQALKKTPLNELPRIINVASKVHFNAGFDLSDIPPTDISGYEVYGLSKLCLVMFSYKLADELKGKINVNVLHPGVIDTKMLREGFGKEGDDIKEGAETPVYLADSEDVKDITGKYYDEKKETPSSEISYDKELQNDLYEKTLFIVQKYMKKPKF